MTGISPVFLLDPDDPGETGKPGEVIRGFGVFVRRGV